MTEDAPRSGATPLRIRPFERDDFDALFRLDAAARGPSPTGIGAPVEAFRASLRLPRADPERNVFVAEYAGEPSGYARLDLELNIGRVVGWLQIAAGTRGPETTRALIGATLARARETGARVLHVPVEDAANATRSRVLLAAGMRVIRRYWRMRRPAVPVEAPPVPEGVSVRPYAAGRDESLLTELQNAAFAGNWGYSPNTVDEVAAHVALPGHGPGGILFLEDGTRPVAYCWVRWSDQQCGAAGAIHMMGVRPAHRGRGLGRLVASLGVRLASGQPRREVELEVDEANDAAAALYRMLGFERVSDVLWYELRLSG